MEELEELEEMEELEELEELVLCLLALGAFSVVETGTCLLLVDMSNTVATAGAREMVSL